MRIIAFDPGGEHTGWAIWDEFGHFIGFGQIEEEPAHAILWRFLHSSNANIIVYEQFDKETANPGANLDAIEYIGTIKTYAQINSVRLVAQQRSIKKWATNEKLKQVGVAHKNWHTERHAADAQRHILYFLAHNPYIPDELQRQTLLSLRPA
jgi:hypothetical protein